MNKILTLVAACGITLFATAQNAFDTVVATIVDNNASLQGQIKLNNASALENTDDNRLADPEVSFARVWGRHSIGNKLQFDVTQSFDWPGAYSARSKANAMDTPVAMAQLQAARLDLANEARALLVELIFVRHQRHVVEDLMDNFQKLGDAIDKGVKGGELTVLDQRKMQIENFEIENELASTIAREQEIICSLQAMTTARLDLSGIVEYPVQPLLSRQEYLDQVPLDPNVAASVLEAEQEQLKAKAASRARMPGFTVGYQHQAEMGDRFNGFTVGMNLPVYGRNAKKAALERKDAADLSRDMAVARRNAEIDGAYSDLLIQRERINAYRNTFGDNRYLDLLLKAYNGGQITVIEYLSEVHYYHQTMLTYLEAEYSYNAALTKLNQLIMDN